MPVVPGITISGINFTLTSRDTAYDTLGICGMAYDRETGEPIAGVQVTVYRRDTLVDSIIVVGSVYTDSLGKYCIFLKKSGDYILEALPPSGLNYIPIRREVYVPDGTVVTVNLPFVREKEVVRLCCYVGSACYCRINLPVEVTLYDRDKKPLITKVIKDSSLIDSLEVCFDSLKYGDTVYVSASSPGFYTGFYKNARDLASATPIVMMRDKWVEILLIHMHDSVGVVMGRVTEEGSGNPIYTARVCIPSLGVCRYTSTSGLFYLSHIPNGKYIVCVTHPNYMKTCSDSFTVSSDTVVVDIVMKADTLKPSRIRGKIVDSNGECIEIAAAMVFPVDSDTPIAYGVVEFDSIGECFYEVVVPPGEYHVFGVGLEFKGEWYDDKKERKNADIVRVKAGEIVTGIDFVLDLLGTGKITGKIIDPTEKPIPHALVWAESNIGVYKETLSDSLGNYVLKVPPGVYRVGAEAKGFEPNVYEKEIPVGEGVVVEGINIVLTPLPQTPHKITGRVVDDSTGEGIFPALVVAISPEFCGYTITDALGNYEITDVPPAKERYVVFAWAPLYLPEFYDNTINLADATLVDSDQSGVDFGLRAMMRLGVRALRGLVKAKDGTPIEGAVIYVLEGTAKGEEVVIGGGKTGKDGRYMIPNLPDGVYTVRISKPGYEETTCPSVDLVGKNSEVDVELEEMGVEEPKVKIKEIEFSCTPSVSYGVVDVSFALPRAMKVKVVLYDVTGREISVLVNRKLSQGRHSFDLNTAHLSQGVYFLKLITATEKRVRKLLLIR